MTMMQDLNNDIAHMSVGNSKLSKDQKKRGDFISVPPSMILNVIALNEPLTFDQIKRRVTTVTRWTRPQDDALAVKLGEMRRLVRQEWGTGYIIMTSHKGETHYKLTPGARKRWKEEVWPMIQHFAEEAA